jgi:nicotinate dehydrogenase subunit A
MSTVNLKVNGRSHTVNVEPRTPLLYILRNDLELYGPKFGCGRRPMNTMTFVASAVFIPWRAYL